MVRRTIDPKLQAKIFERYDNRCFICGYSIRQALVVHHIIPAELWGKDSYDEQNLVLICANCHRIVHRFSTKKYNDANLNDFLSSELNDDSIKKVENIIQRAREFKNEIKRKGNIVENPYAVKEAVDIIAEKNGFSDEKRNQLFGVLDVIIAHIPIDIVPKCSYRLLKNGKYVSTSLMNYLLFRTPGFGDFGEIPIYECLMSYPLNKIPQEFSPIDNREPYYFKYVEAVNIGLSYDEALDLSEVDWEAFSEVCRKINDARKTRNWISNIDVKKRD